MIEARQHFRAPISDEQFALLIVGLRRLTVRLVEQSSGGLSMFSDRVPDFECDAQAEVKYSDGFCISGRIKHIDPCDEGFRIGFLRSEMIDEKIVDLRDSFAAVEQQRSVPLRTVVATLVVGVGLGWLWQSGTAAKLYDRAAAAVRNR